MLLLHPAILLFWCLQVVDDNLSVPFVSAVVAALILPHAEKAAVFLSL